MEPSLTPLYIWYIITGEHSHHKRSELKYGGVQHHKGLFLAYQDAEKRLAYLFRPEKD